MAMYHVCVEPMEVRREHPWNWAYRWWVLGI